MLRLSYELAETEREKTAAKKLLLQEIAAEQSRLGSSLKDGMAESQRTKEVQEQLAPGVACAAVGTAPSTLASSTAASSTMSSTATPDVDT